MYKVDLVISNGTIITMNENNQILHDGSIVVKDGCITDIDDTDKIIEKYEPNIQIDAKSGVVMPGFIDAYAHAGHSMIKGIWDPAEGWPSNDLYFNATDEEFWYADGLLGSIDRLMNGVTTGVSIIGATPARVDELSFIEEHIKAVNDVGIRDIVGVGPPDLFIPSQKRLESTIWINGTPKKKNFTYDETLDNSIEIIKRWNNKLNKRIRVVLAYPYIFGRIHSLKDPVGYKYTKKDTKKLLEKSLEIRSIAEKYGVQIHSHVFGGAIEFALQKFEKEIILDLLGPDVVLAHCNSLTQDEVKIISETRTNVASAPSAISPLKYGRCPVPELLEAGVNVVTTTDGAAPVMSLDPFISMRSELRIQRYHLQDPSTLPTGKLLKMTTIDAAKALGVGEFLGSIEIGKRADIIIVDMSKPHLTPKMMPPKMLVYYASGHDVNTVIVDGKILMKDRVMRKVDKDEVLVRANKAINSAFDRYEKIGYNISKFLDIDKGFWEAQK